MEKQLQITTIIILSALSLNACFDKDNEVEIPASEVPANIITIVQNTLPGIDLSETKKEVKDGTVIYELEGVLINGKEYEIKISEDGTIIKIELED